MSNTHAIELTLQQIARLAIEHVEDLAPHRLVPRDTLGPGLALAVPRPDTVAAVDYVQPDGEGVDDLGGERPLHLHLVRAQRHLGGEILGQLGRGENGGEDATHDDHHVVGDCFVAAGGDDDLEGAERLVVMDQGQPQHRPAGHLLALRPLARPLGDRPRVAWQLRLVPGRGDSGEARAIGRTQPQSAAAQRETAGQRVDHPLQGLSRH